MIIFYALINSVIGDVCCFKAWTEWQQSSLTCGEVCRLRKKDLCVFSFGNLCLSSDCSNYDICPWFETENDSCETIVCREYDFKIKLFVRYL